MIQEHKGFKLNHFLSLRNDLNRYYFALAFLYRSSVSELDMRSTYKSFCDLKNDNLDTDNLFAKYVSPRLVYFFAHH